MHIRVSHVPTMLSYKQAWHVLGRRMPQYCERKPDALHAVSLLFCCNVHEDSLPLLQAGCGQVGAVYEVCA